jgi:molybdate transport system permease protein
LTQTTGGEVAALRLTVIAVVVSFAALLAAEMLGRVLARRIEA